MSGINCIYQRQQDVDSKRQHRSLIYKFLFIPVVFVLLRLWTSILNILYVYVGLEEEQVPFWVNETLVYLAVSVPTMISVSFCEIIL